MDSSDGMAWPEVMRRLEILGRRWDLACIENMAVLPGIRAGELLRRVNSQSPGRRLTWKEERRMGEASGPAPRDVDLVAVVRGVLEDLGVPDALAVAEVMALYRDHPRWACGCPRPVACGQRRGLLARARLDQKYR